MTVRNYTSKYKARRIELVQWNLVSVYSLCHSLFVVRINWSEASNPPLGIALLSNVNGSTYRLTYSVSTYSVSK